jgi:hypothetical protein
MAVYLLTDTLDLKLLCRPSRLVGNVGNNRSSLLVNPFFERGNDTTLRPRAR